MARKNRSSHQQGDEKTPSRRLFLISNSRSPTGEFLQHCRPHLSSFLAGTQEVLFVPYALGNHQQYTDLVSDSFRRCGYEIRSLHAAENRINALRCAEAIFVGGGNTFRLLKSLYDLSLMKEIRDCVLRGTPYVGSSAGTNIACPTIKTTNDMPIAFPPSLNALGLVPFSINPHYYDPPDNWDHAGETRADRIREFHELNSEPVVGLREGAWLRIDNDKLSVEGVSGLRLFARGAQPRDYQPGARLDFLLKQATSGSQDSELQLADEI